MPCFDVLEQQLPLSSITLQLLGGKESHFSCEFEK